MKKNKKYEIYYFNQNGELLRGLIFNGSKHHIFKVTMKNCLDNEFFIVLEDGEIPIYVTPSDGVLNEEVFYPQIDSFKNTQKLIEIENKKNIKEGNSILEELKTAIANEDYLLAAKLRDYCIENNIDISNI